MIGMCRKLRIGLDPARRLVAVDDRKLNVHENEIRPVLRRHRHPLLAVDGLDQLEAGIGEQIAENAPVVLGVLDDENAFAHAAASARSRAPERRW